ncbi:MAG: response regulator [Treponemataceae bacterium]|nr:response regulator [Treponemataceae bacterium]
MRNYYAAASFIGCTVLFILFIRMKELESPTNYKKKFRALLIYVTSACIDDMLWGLCFRAAFGINQALFYVVGYAYFILTMLSNKAWLEYAAIRMQDRKAGNLITAFGWLSFFLQMLILVSNVFTKNVFYIRADNSYIVGISRTIIFGLQGFNGLIILIDNLIHRQTDDEFKKEERHYSIVIAVLVMLTTFSTWYSTDSPMFSLGYMIVCVSIYVLDITQLLVIKNRRLTNQHKEILHEQDTVHEVYIQAQKANDAKRAFLATISHDMRSPMNAIMGMTRIAKANLHDTEKVADCLDTVNAASEQLLNLINQILDMNRIESGNLSLHTDFISLSEQFSTVIDIVSTQMIQKKLDFNTNILKLIHDDVFGDAKRIQQCCVALLSNAIKYTPEGGRITFSVRELPSDTDLAGTYQITVRDTGYGISDTELPHIFDPFFRSADPRIQAETGSGLGLSIVKNITTMMNGTLSVESEQEAGTTVTMTLSLALADEDEVLNPKNLAGHTALIIDSNPVSCESMLYALSNLGMTGDYCSTIQEALSKISDRQKNNDLYSCIILDWKIPNTNGLETAQTIRHVLGDTMPLLIASAYDWADIEDDATNCKINGFISKPLERTRLENTLATVILGSMTAKQRVHEIRNRKPNLSEMRVLLVEDNDLTRDIAVELLQMHEFKVEYAINGRDAVTMVENCDDGYYDFILMDIQMPILNGYEATQQIRAMEREYAKKIPIIAMTANAFTEDKNAAKSAGMNDHLAKPLDIPQLIETLKRYL